MSLTTWKSGEIKSNKPKHHNEKENKFQEIRQPWKQVGERPFFL